jgi:hypothetical protein
MCHLVVCIQNRSFRIRAGHSLHMIFSLYNMVTEQTGWPCGDTLVFGRCSFQIGQDTLYPYCLFLVVFLSPSR